jgi:integrase/recombinase XerC
MNQPLVIAAPDVIAEQQHWLNQLTDERRLSPKTADAYERDLRQFLSFLTTHLGGPPRIADLADLRPLDLRAFMAERRRGGAGARTLGRGLAGIRSFLRHLERKGMANAAGASATRAPRQPKSLPKPLSARDALRVVDTDLQMSDEPWIAARSSAVLTLLYGCGLRISEALSLTANDLPRDGEALRITGKGGKTRIVPLLPVARKPSPNTAGSAPIRPVPISRCSAAPAADRCSRPSCRRRCGACARRSTCPIPPPRMRSGTPSPPIFSPAAAISGPSRNCSATPACRRPRSTPALMPAASSRSTTAPIPAPEPKSRPRTSAPHT